MYMDWQAKDQDAEAERILLEDVQEAIKDMAQIMESYKSKNMVSKLLVSTLCKRRQEEAEEAINAAVHRLQVYLHTYLLAVESWPSMSVQLLLVTDPRTCCVYSGGSCIEQ